MVVDKIALAYLLGFLIGDGSIYRHGDRLQAVILVKEGYELRKILELLRLVGLSHSMTMRVEHRGHDGSILRRVNLHKKTTPFLQAIFDAPGRIPDWFESEEEILSLLAGLWDSEGTINRVKSRGRSYLQISYSTKDEIRAEKVLEMLRSLDYFASNKSYENSGFGDGLASRINRVYIHTRSFYKFATEIGPLLNPLKAENL